MQVDDPEMHSYVPWSTGTCGRHTSCRVARPPSVHVVLTLVVAAECISRRGHGANNDGVVHRNDATRFAKRTMKSVVKAINDVFKEGVTLVPLFIEDSMESDYTKRSQLPF